MGKHGSNGNALFVLLGNQCLQFGRDWMFSQRRSEGYKRATGGLTLQRIITTSGDWKRHSIYDLVRVFVALPLEHTYYLAGHICLRIFLIIEHLFEKRMYALWRMQDGAIFSCIVNGLQLLERHLLTSLRG